MPTAVPSFMMNHIKTFSRTVEIEDEGWLRTNRTVTVSSRSEQSGSPTRTLEVDHAWSSLVVKAVAISK